jgi:TolA-binding protein
MNTNFELGEAYRDMGLYDDAIDEFEQALDDPDAAPEARYRIAVCKAEKGETDEAATTLDQLLQNGELSEDLRSAARDKLDELNGRRA